MADIFRKKSLDKLSSPEQLDRMIIINSPMTWVALSGGAFVILVALLWSIFGRVPITEEGNGILLREGEVHSVYAGTQGVVTKVNVSSGDVVKAGDVLYEVGSSQTSLPADDIMDGMEIKSTVSGVVYSTFITNGSTVTADMEVARIRESEDEGKMQAVYFMPLNGGKKVKKGMAVNIYPSTLAKEKYGHMSGTVVKVAGYVTSSADLLTRVGDPTLAQIFSDNGAVVEVVCEIETDENTVSGYAWSSQKGSNVELQEGTLLEGSVVMENVSPITMLIPILREKFNLE